MRLMKLFLALACSINAFTALAQTDDKLILELDLETDGLSMSHYIDNFFFAPSENYAVGSDQNMNDMSYPALVNHLIATAMVRMNGEVIGVATEQEIVHFDETTGLPSANSAWLIKLNAPGLTGFIAVEQIEDASATGMLIGEVMADPQADWADTFQFVLSSVPGTHVQYASGDLAKYQGGIFEEYNAINQTDIKNFGRFRGRIRFEIYSAE